MVATRGPAPKRSTERRRRNTGEEATTAKVTGRVRIPAAPKSLHPAAKRWYSALRQSGQAQFFEPSDWAAALFVAEAMSRNLGIWDKDAKAWVDNHGHEGLDELGRRVWVQPRFSAQMFAAVWSAMDDLLTTEAARRRARLEVERDAGEEETPPGVTAIAQYRQALGE